MEEATAAWGGEGSNNQDLHLSSLKPSTCRSTPPPCSLCDVAVCHVCSSRLPQDWAMPHLSRGPRCLFQGLDLGVPRENAVTRFRSDRMKRQALPFVLLKKASFIQLRGFFPRELYCPQNKPEVDQKALFLYSYSSHKWKKFLCYLKYLRQIVQCCLLAQVLIIVANLVTCVWRRTMPQKFLKAKQQSAAFVVMRCKLPTSGVEPTKICNEVFFSPS